MLMSNLKHESFMKNQVFILNYKNVEMHYKVITKQQSWNFSFLQKRHHSSAEAYTKFKKTKKNLYWLWNIQ